jgi:hypothetical protein
MNTQSKIYRVFICGMVYPPKQLQPVSFISKLCSGETHTPPNKTIGSTKAWFVFLATSVGTVGTSFQFFLHRTNGALAQSMAIISEADAQRTVCLHAAHKALEAKSLQCVDDLVTFDTRIIHLMFLLFDVATCFDLGRSSSGCVSDNDLLRSKHVAT